MDIATIVGLILGTVMVVVAILIGGDVVSYLNAPSVLIVIGGATAATMTAFPLARFLKLPKVMGKAVVSKTGDPLEMIKKLVELAEVARRDGILALESKIEEVEDDFLVSGIQMAVDGTDPEVIETIIETDLRT